MMLPRSLLIAGMALLLLASVQAKPRSLGDPLAEGSVVAQCHALMAAHDFDNAGPVCQQAVAVLAASAEGKAEVEWLRRRWALLEQMVASGEARRYRNEGTMDCILPDPPPPRRLSEEGDTLLEFQMGTDPATLPQLHVRQTSGVPSVDRIAFGIGERMQCLPGIKAIRFRLPVALRLPSDSGPAAAAP
ncbi:hypothetical protein ACI1Y9_10225 [Bordetella trematum]